jgi:hypothetical protein
MFRLRRAEMRNAWMVRLLYRWVPSVRRQLDGSVVYGVLRRA